MKVTNRSDGSVVYALPELNIRRDFNVGESKEIEVSELEALYSKNGGAEILRNFLMVEDKEWVKSHWDAPIEYFWGIDKIRKCILEDPVDLFSETLDYAPTGVIDLIKQESWKLPMNDLNKIDVLYNKTGFNVQIAAKFMKPPEGEEKPKSKTERRRREED